LLASGEAFFAEDEAIIEAVYVLEHLAGFDRLAIRILLQAIFGHRAIKCNRPLFQKVLADYCVHPKLAFIDCYLALRSAETKALPLYTFDKKLANQMPQARLVS
jgi:predicted nucleic-acid-binding protein